MDNFEPEKMNRNKVPSYKKKCFTQELEATQLFHKCSVLPLVHPSPAFPLFPTAFNGSFKPFVVLPSASPCKHSELQDKTGKLGNKMALKFTMSLKLDQLI